MGFNEDGSGEYRLPEIEREQNYTPALTIAEVDAFGDAGIDPPICYTKLKQTWVTKKIKIECTVEVTFNGKQVGVCQGWSKGNFLGLPKNIQQILNSIYDREFVN